MPLGEVDEPPVEVPPVAPPRDVLPPVAVLPPAAEVPPVLLPPAVKPPAIVPPMEEPPVAVLPPIALPPVAPPRAPPVAVPPDVEPPAGVPPPEKVLPVDVGVPAPPFAEFPPVTPASLWAVLPPEAVMVLLLPPSPPLPPIPTLSGVVAPAFPPRPECEGGSKLHAPPSASKARIGVGGNFMNTLLCFGLQNPGRRGIGNRCRTPGGL